MSTRPPMDDLDLNPDPQRPNYASGHPRRRRRGPGNVVTAIVLLAILIAVLAVLLVF